MPRDTLTRDQIVTAAIGLLDAEGLEGLNMRALGTLLGSAATAVYWHVGSKDNLIALAADQVWTEITLPDPAAAGWRATAAAMADGLHAMLTRHPWLVQAFGTQVLSGTGKARYNDHSLAIYEAAGFIAAQADQAAATVFTYVLGNALGQPPRPRLRGSSAATAVTPASSYAPAWPRPARSRRSSRGCAPASEHPPPTTPRHPTTASSSASKLSSTAWRPSSPPAVGQSARTRKPPRHGANAHGEHSVSDRSAPAAGRLRGRTQPGRARPGSATSSARALAISSLSPGSASGYLGLIACSAVTRTAAVPGG